MTSRSSWSGRWVACQKTTTSAERWREQVDDGSRSIVGLNIYQTDDPTPANLFKVDPEAEGIAVERIQTLRAERDNAKWEKAMEAYGNEADLFASRDYEEINGSLIESAIDAAGADATTGEMMSVLKDTLGWKAPHEF